MPCWRPSPPSATPSRTPSWSARPLWTSASRCPGSAARRERSTTPRVRADIGLEWPTWSQAAYRSWAIGEGFDEPPELILEVTLRLQRLVAPPDPRVALGLLPEEIHALGSGCDTLERADPSVEQVFGKPPEVAECSLEVTYEGTLRLDEPVLESPDALQNTFAPLARWVASTLVRLGDLPFEFLPEEESEAEASD